MLRGQEGTERGLATGKQAESSSWLLWKGKKRVIDDEVSDD